MSRNSPRGGGNPYAQADSFTKKAKAEGYPARSVYKLEEIDRRCQLLRPGMRVLDLGCAPGSWLLYAAKKIGPSGRAVGIDLTPLQIALPPNAVAIAGDAFERTGEVAAHLALAAPYDVIVSDMAPNTTGTRIQDQARSADLVERSLDVAAELLAPGGSWVAKLFMSEALVSIRARVRKMFTTERIIRPEGTRSVSYEVFLVGQKKK
ncbi:MAG: SAM-dependent methyltransferase [Polyangiales bacterium]